MRELTKDADKLICCIYKEYLEKRKSGISKPEAKKFDGNFYKDIKALSNWSSQDISDTLEELKKKEYIARNILGEITLTDESIIYMENRFKDGLKEVMDFISSLPLI